MSPDTTSRPRASRIPFVAALLAGSILLSRALGLVREMVLASQLGAGAEVDAYRAAFQIPDILNHFRAGGAFAVAFVPFYLRIRAARGDEAGALCGVPVGFKDIYYTAGLRTAAGSRVYADFVPT